MTFAKLDRFLLPTASTLIDAARRVFQANQDIPAMAAPVAQAVVSDDHSRYARLLENELDRQHLTDVEREDTDMLNRVRAALYDD
ncbi:hypothetical protein L0664_16670 [Octadecabacter sp. G9-8]|uniref:Uncharacterized protein n=1 Tax=Octadecabacter dasysiphoniae TaxID=2909341 RepID=A0ABS9CZK1_9RHOB|nr:hypothetical protein [Octadecabacter dasysiphoniae]MCF2872706.1 hypothetical protein [Octadecabacter dasysiphoniae]